MDKDLMYKELKRDEGIARSPYSDTKGHPTVGIGYNLNARKLPDGMSYPLSDIDIKTLYDITAEDTEKQLNTYLPWWQDLDEVRQRVVFNMCFNLGIDKLLKFVNTLTSMGDGDYNTAATEMEASIWYRQVGKRAVRLCKAMRTGIMPDE